MSTSARAKGPSFDPSRPDTAPHDDAEADGSSAGVELLLTLFRYFWVMLALALLFALVTGVRGLRQGRVYGAESAFILDSDRASASPASGLAAQFGIALPQGNNAQTPAFYADFLKSPSILRRVVDSAVVVQTPTGRVTLDLIDSVPGRDRPRAVRRQDAIQLLGNRIGVTTAQRTGVVTVRVVHPSPYVALALNRRLLELLNEFNVERRRAQTSDQRAFAQERLAEARDNLRAAEERLRAFQQANRAFVPSSPAYLQQQRLERDVSVRSQLFQSLQQSFEQARLEEFREAALIAVIQEPELPVSPESRRLVRKTSVAFLIGAVLGLFLGYLMESWRRFRARNPGFFRALRHRARRAPA